MRFISRIRSLVRDLVRDEKVSLNFGDRHPNAHILAIEPESIEKQIEKLDQVVFEAPTYEQFDPVRMRTNPLNCCCYPTRTHLHGIVIPATMLVVRIPSSWLRASQLVCSNQIQPY
jgi:hypothetical protein